MQPFDVGTSASSTSFMKSRNRLSPAWKVGPQSAWLIVNVIEQARPGRAAPAGSDREDGQRPDPRVDVMFPPSHAATS